MSDTPPFTNEAAQAFVEDLAAVYAKHGLQLGSQEDIFPLGLRPDSRFLYIDSAKDLRIGEDDPRDEPLEWYEMVEDSRKNWPVAPIPNTAHGRLGAAARIDAIRKEQETSDA